MGTILCSDSTSVGVKSEALEAMLNACMEAEDIFNDTELTFIYKLHGNLEQFQGGLYISTKQLQWVRELHARV